MPTCHHNHKSSHINVKFSHKRANPGAGSRIIATAIAIGASVSLCLWLAARSLGPSPGARFHHFAQSLIPVAACGAFFGLSAVTVTMLRAEGFALGYVGPLWALPLGGAAVWSIVLAWKIAGLGSKHILHRFAATVFVALVAATGTGNWILYFWIW